MADPVPVVAVSRSGTSATHVDAAFTPADLIEAWSEQLGEEARDVHGCPHRWKRRWPAPCLPNWQTRITGRLWATRLDRKNSQGRRTSAISPARWHWWSWSTVLTTVRPLNQCGETVYRPRRMRD